MPVLAIRKPPHRAMKISIAKLCWQPERHCLTQEKFNDKDTGQVGCIND